MKIILEVHIKGEKRKSRKGDWFLLASSLIMLLASAGFFVYAQYPSLFEFSYEMEKNSEISPKDSIIVNFSNPIIPNYLGWKVEVSPKTNFSYRLENKNRRLIISPNEYWLPESEYEISILGRNFLLASIGKTFQFKTISYPALVEFYPAEGAKDVLLDIEDPIKAKFDKSIDGFNIKFVINPNKELESKANDDKNEISIMLKEDLEKGQRYTVDVYARYK